MHDKIYADTTEGMTLQSIPGFTVTQENLNAAREQIEREATTQSLAIINELVAEKLAIDQTRLRLKFEDISSNQVGDISEETSVTQKITAHGLIFDQENFINKAKEKLSKELEGGQVLVNFDEEKITYNVTAPVGPKGEGDGHGHVTISIDSELSEEKNEGIESVLVKLNKDGTPDKENYFTGVQDLLKGVIEYVMKLGTGGTYQEYLKYRSTDRFAAGTEVELPVGAYVVIIDGEQFIFEPAKKIVDPNEPQTWQDIEFDIDVPAAYQPEGTGKGGDGKTPNALAGSNATNFSDAGTS